MRKMVRRLFSHSWVAVTRRKKGERGESVVQRQSRREKEQKGDMRIHDRIPGSAVRKKKKKLIEGLRGFRGVLSQGEKTNRKGEKKRKTENKGKRKKRGKKRQKTSNNTQGGKKKKPPPPESGDKEAGTLIWG